MGTYIALCNYTDKGIANIKDSPDRAEAARKALQAMGGDMDQLYLTMGGYDLVAIVTLPSDEDAAKFMLTLGKLGNIRTTTLRAFNEAEYREIVASVS